jgi:hypothetical protein
LQTNSERNGVQSSYRQYVAPSVIVSYQNVSPSRRSPRRNEDERRRKKQTRTRSSKMEEARYGTGNWTVAQIREKFLVHLDVHGGPSAIQKANGKIFELLQTAIYEQQVAARKASRLELSLENMKSEKTVEVATEQLEHKSTQRLNSDEKVASVKLKIRDEAKVYGEAQYELALWNRVVDSMKAIAKRVDTAAMMEAVERKISMAFGSRAPTKLGDKPNEF